MSDDWSFKQDLKNTSWKLTLIYNLQRAFAAGITWVPLSLIINQETTASLLLFPIIYLIFLVPISLIVYLLARIGVPFVGLIEILLSLAVVVGDPLVYIAHKILPPGIIPVEKPKFLNFNIFIFVTMPEDKGGFEQEHEHDFKRAQGRHEVARPVLSISDLDEIGSSQNVGLVESVMAKSLIDHAVLLEAENNQESSEKALPLWQQALKIGGLSVRDELLCHYYIGGYCRAVENVPECIKHYEKIASADPDLLFLNEPEETIRYLTRADFYKSLSAAYQFYAKTVIKEYEGVEAAIGYLENKVENLRGMAAASLLLELGLYCELVGYSAKAKETFKKVLAAPTYGAKCQEEARDTAAKLLQEAGTDLVSQNCQEDTEIQMKTVGLDLNEVIVSRPKKWAKILVLAGFSVVVLGAALAFLVQSPYRKHIKEAKDLYNSGRFREAMASVEKAGVRKRTAELASLEKELVARINEQKERERQAALMREYDSFYRSALTALQSRNFEEARSFALLARERMVTPQINSLLEQAERQLRLQQEIAEQRHQREIQRQRAAADNAAFRAAISSGTEEGYNQYLQAYPDGHYASDARRRLAILQKQAAQRAVSLPLSQDSVASQNKPAPVQNQQAIESRMRNSLKVALRRLEYRQTPSTPRRPGAPTVEISRAREREKSLWMDRTVRSIEAGLAALREALADAEKIANQNAIEMITRWVEITENAREQLVSKKALSDTNSFNNQRQVVEEIRLFLYR